MEPNWKLKAAAHFMGELELLKEIGKLTDERDAWRRTAECIQLPKEPPAALIHALAKAPGRWRFLEEAEKIDRIKAANKVYRVMRDVARQTLAKAKKDAERRLQSGGKNRVTD